SRTATSHHGVRRGGSPGSGCARADGNPSTIRNAEIGCSVAKIGGTLDQRGLGKGRGPGRSIRLGAGDRVHQQGPLVVKRGGCVLVAGSIGPTRRRNPGADGRPLVHAAAHDGDRDGARVETWSGSRGIGAYADRPRIGEGS